MVVFSQIFFAIAHLAILAATTIASASNERIIGGQVVTTIDYPHFVSIRVPSPHLPAPVHLFSGSIVSPKWIMTIAAYLPAEFEPESFYSTYYAVVGIGSVGQLYDIDYFVRHPAFCPTNLDNNIALMRTNVTMEWNERARPIGLSSRVIGDGYRSFVVGYASVCMPNNFECVEFVYERFHFYSFYFSTSSHTSPTN